MRQDAALGCATANTTASAHGAHRRHPGFAGAAGGLGSCTSSRVSVRATRSRRSAKLATTASNRALKASSRASMLVCMLQDRGHHRSAHAQHRPPIRPCPRHAVTLSHSPTRCERLNFRMCFCRKPAGGDFGAGMGSLAPIPKRVGNPHPRLSSLLIKSLGYDFRRAIACEPPVCTCFRAFRSRFMVISGPCKELLDRLHVR